MSSAEESAVGALGEVIKGSAYALKVRISACESLASYVHNGGAVSALSDVMKGSAYPEELRIAAAKALGNVRR